MYKKRELRKTKKIEENSLTEKKFTKTCISWYPGHMVKTKRLIRENLKWIDLVYEVIDARIPKSSKIMDLDNYLNDKPRILIFTKMDLCDLTETKKWMQYYEKQGYTVVGVDLMQPNAIQKIINATDTYTKKMNDKRNEKGMNARKTRVLVVGIPNVGKSTLINRLVGKKAVNVGNKPGITKNLDWIRINENLELLDSPGILWPKFENNTVAMNLASLTAIKEEVLPLDEVVLYILKMLEDYYPHLLQERYQIESIAEDPVETLEIIGKRRGCLLRGGEIDYEKVYGVILNDVKEGRMKGITFDRIEQERE